MKSIIRLAGQWLFIVAVVRCGGAEQLDRGLVAIPMDQERIYLGWRWLADDRPETGFWLQKASSSEGPWRTMNSQPIKDSCNYVDEQAGSQSSYYRVTVANAAQADIAKPVVVQSPGQRYLSIKVLVVNNRILKYPNQEFGRLEGRIVAIADCLGDWREEIVTALDGEIRIYTTTTPAYSRRVCLMQDRLYRTDVAMQTMGYFYPPQLGGTPLTAAKR